jgi:hypothetical protein
LGFDVKRLYPRLKEEDEFYALLNKLTDEIVDKCREDYKKHASNITFPSTYYILFTDHVFNENRTFLYITRFFKK